MNRLFNNTNTRRPKKSAFNLSHEVKQSINMAELTPFYLEEVIPGDSFKVKSEVLLRMAPLISPVMHRLNLTTHYFFCPNRITWDNWTKFITGGEDGNYNGTIPTINVGSSDFGRVGEGTLADYFGIPPAPAGGTAQYQTKLNAMPFRGYQMIFDEYYRDQNLQPKLDLSTGDTVDDIPNLLQLRTRAWEKDYFTSALPWAQKGDPVGIPVDFNYKNISIVKEADGSVPPSGTNLEAGAALEDGAALHETPPSGEFLRIENLEEDGVSVTIEELRRSVRLQEWLEKNARAGSRYIESIKSHFGERVPDYTAQRPIFLGGGRQPITISEVLQTSETGTAPDGTPQGNMAGHGISVGAANSFKGKFTEHGFIIGIMSVLPRTAYQQGVDKFWTKQDKFDFYWPEFAQLGEQPVFNSELYHDWEGTQADNLGTFGYQSRYSEYKYRPSRVAGEFRSNLAFWHMGRIFQNRPSLNSDFVTADPRTDIFAVEDVATNKLYVQIYNNVKAMRPIPATNIPTL